MIRGQAYGTRLAVCSRARLARDARFDGKFFIAVITTGIYCRPICRTRTSRETNVRYFRTAAAAAEAGFRPCLRCRPESSPGMPPWAGTQSTVSRALRLIGESGLDEGGVEALAARLGVGSRHLRRLFLRHLGAPPSAVAQTRRLHFAKKLIDETRLTMTEIAQASGFGCVRRFNAAIRKTYRRTPSEIRRLARQIRPQAKNQYVFRLHFRPPYHWQAMLEFLAARATPGVEMVETGHYRRTISINGSAGYLDVSLDASRDMLLAEIEFPDPCGLSYIIERIRAMFDLSSDWATIARCLRHDPLLARCLERYPGLRVPGCWNGFELAVRAILGQAITVKGATELAGRIARSLGKPFYGANGLTHLFPGPETLANASLVDIGLTRARAEAIRGLARAVCDRNLSFEGITETDGFMDRLCQIPGIGRWTAQYVAMRAIGEPDAFPSTDLGLLRGAGISGPRDLERRAESWRPWRAYAAIYLWMAGKQSRRKEAGLSQSKEEWLKTRIGTRQVPAPV